MSLITSSLSEFFRSYPDKAIVIAYSGGVDSQVLLHALSHLKQQGILSNSIVVCHVNHGLSANAQTWQVFAQKQCLQLALPLKICKVNVKAKAQHSLEELARNARYQALQEFAPIDSLIVTGHHNDDQSETFFLALKRGAGLKGLSGMKQVMPLGKQLLVRPLLNVSRQDIEIYAENNNLVWIDDESNEDLRFDRNFIRHQVMPILNSRWPSIAKTLNRSAQHCQEGQELLSELAQQDLEVCITSAHCLSVSQLKLLSHARFNNIIRHFLETHQCLMPSTEQLVQVYKQLNAAADKVPAIKVGDHCFRRFKGELYLTPDFIDICQWTEKVEQTNDSGLEEKSKVILPDDLGVLIFTRFNENANNLTSKYSIQSQHKLVAPLKDQTVTIRFSHDNPKCLPEYRQHSRPLKKVLQELAIPPWQRQRIPFIYYDEVLVAALGYFVCKEYLPQDRQAGLNLTWFKYI